MAFILMLVVMILFIKGMEARKNPDITYGIPNDCPPHKWTYIEGNKMQCELCQFIAGTHNTDRGNY